MVISVIGKTVFIWHLIQSSILYFLRRFHAKTSNIHAFRTAKDAIATKYTSMYIWLLRVLFRTATEGGGSMQQRVCGANSTLSSVHGGTLLNSGMGGGGYPFFRLFSGMRQFWSGSGKTCLR